MYAPPSLIRGEQGVVYAGGTEEVACMGGGALPPVGSPRRCTVARMSALAFDTHRAVKALCESGAAEPLAEAFVETIGGNVTTKADIAKSEARASEDRLRPGGNES